MATSRKSTHPRGKIIFAGSNWGIASGVAAIAKRGDFPFRENNSDIGIKRGRSSPKDIIQKEAQRRFKVGKVPSKKFRGDLRDWFIAKYPRKKPPSETMIARYIRDLRRG
jgi:hypothetical protein